MTLGNELNEDLHKFLNEIRKTFYFMKEGFKNIENRFKEADIYKKEFEHDINILEKNVSKLKGSDQFAKRLRQSLQRIDTLARIYEFADTQQETAYRMAHVFMISIYEGFTKVIFQKVYRNNPELMTSRKYSLSIITSMNSNELEELISKKIDKVANVDILESLLNRADIAIDIINNFSKWNDLKENYYRRHVIVHNHGIYDKKYVDNTNSSNTLIGTEIKTDYEYIKQLAKNICGYMAFLVSNFLSLLSLTISVKSIEEDAKDILHKLKKHTKK